MVGTTLRTARAPRLIATVSLDLASVAANTSAEQDVTVQGVRPDMWLLVKGLSLPAGLIVANAHCEAADTLKLTMANLTANPINATAQDFEILAL